MPFTEAEILAKKERPTAEVEQVQLLICHLKVAFTKDCFTSCKEHQNITTYEQPHVAATSLFFILEGLYILLNL